VNKKRFIGAVAVCIVVVATAGGTYAAFQASTSTEKTISTASLEVVLQMKGAQVSENGEVVYTPENIKEGEIKERVSAANHGSRDMYIRIHVNKAWYQENEKVNQVDGKSVQASAIGVSFINDEDWIVEQKAAEGEDFYIYYRKPVAAGKETSDFMDAFTLMKDMQENTNQYTGLHARMKFDAEAIQTVAAEQAMLAEWGVQVTFQPDGSMKAVSSQQ
ncbi:MAG: N-acetylmuramoyl-L-alanine amidase, partial [Lachnospira sp.]|jgi:predicted ribosomally synthesized peptide with SipW-like signal peptide|nr:N-acetylmuramoyl-L-alanine amidase [Lachnospira sp.]